jgi:hypothetical protein
MKLLAALAIAATLSVNLSPASAETTRIRGTLMEFDTSKITIAKPDGGVEPIGVHADTRYLSVAPIGIDAIVPGSYIGVAGLPQPDGTIKALGVMVFPESARGTAEGHFPYDLQPESTMTNATVGKVSQLGSGREVVVTYGSESKTIDIVDPEKVASFTPSDSSILVDGAKTVVIVDRGADGLPTARAVLVGKDGFTPPN